MDLPKLPDVCQCANPGFCPFFMRQMDLNPPDWVWCKTASYEDRDSFHRLLDKAPCDEKKEELKLLKYLEEQGIDVRYLNLYKRTLLTQHNICKKANKNQLKRNQIIDSYLRMKLAEPDFSNVEILCLGHSEEQFKHIKDRPYLKKVNLNEIDASDYSENKWAEGRAFMSITSLFSDSAEFVGFTTASWNHKYSTSPAIDQFHTWDTAKVLLNFKGYRNIVLCADIYCPCIWWKSGNNILKVFFGDKGKYVAKLFKATLGIDKSLSHVKVPFSNQFICHREVFEKYQKYLYDNEVFSRIDTLLSSDFVSGAIKTSSELQQQYSLSRLHGYFTELVTCLWFHSQSDNLVFLPNAERDFNWYSPDKIKERVKWLTTSW